MGLRPAMHDCHSGQVDHRGAHDTDRQLHK